jgi:hypothetical protein
MKPRLAISASLLVAILAWAGLAVIVRQFQPTPPLLAAALVLVAIGVAGATMPFWYLLQRRLAPKRNPKTLVGAAAREGLWMGLFAAALVLLRIYDLLNGVLVLVLALVLFLLETFLHQRPAPRQAETAGAAPRSHPPRSAPSTGRTTRTAERGSTSDGGTSRPTTPRKPGGRPAAVYQRTGKTQAAPKSRPKTDGKK